VSTEPGFPQYLNWRRFVAPGVMQLSDGAWMTAKAYLGPDQEYADFLAMEHVAEMINADLAKLSGGWCIQAEVCRASLVLVAGSNHSDHPTVQLLHQERAQASGTANAHFGNRLVVCFTWLPPAEIGQRFSEFFFGKQRAGDKPSRKVLLGLFQEQVEAVCAGLGSNLKFHSLSSEELKSFLWYCVTGEDRKVGAENNNLQYALGAVPVYPHQGLVNGLHTRAVGIYGYPVGVNPQVLEELTNLPFTMRISQRFSYTGQSKGIKELQRKRRIWGYANWYNPKSLGWRQVKHPNDIDESVVERNDDADEQVRSVKRAITQLQAGTEKVGYYTGLVILRDQDEAKVEEQADITMQVLSRKGFSPVLEDYNFAAAFKGSLPGHGGTNRRRPTLTTRHVARMFPWSSQWSGHITHPSPLYPPNSAPLLICKSTGNAPFAFTPEYHSLIIGPIGSGKTVLLNEMSSAQLQYPGGQVHTFDYNAGAAVACLTHGGVCFDLNAMKYSPLAHIDEPNEWSWAYNYLEKLAKLRNYTMPPAAQEDLQRALRDLALAKIEDRHMTGLLGQLQTEDADLQTVLGYYAGGNPGGVIDGRYSPLSESRWLSFDMKEILKRDTDVSTAVLLAQIHALERRIGGKQTLMTFDEGWMGAEQELLDRYLGQQSATARKEVISLALVIHSPGDIRLFKNPDRLLNNISTKIFLPSANANTPAMRQYYSDMGLGSREIKMLAEDMRPKLDYYVVEGNQRRRFQLTWGPWHQAVMGKNGCDFYARLLELHRQYGSDLTPVFLRENGHEDLANQYEHFVSLKEAA
jgi:type IV secretory pathway VirB4 component